MKFLIFILLLLTFSCASKPSVVQWHSPHPSLIKKADQNDKILLVYATKENCLNCILLENKTFSNIDIINTLKHDFLLIKIGWEQYKIDLFLNGVVKVPTLLFFYKKELLGVVYGPVPPGPFKIILDDIKQKANKIESGGLGKSHLFRIWHYSRYL